MEAARGDQLYSPERASCASLQMGARQERESLDRYFYNRIVHHSGRNHLETVCMLYRLWDVALHELAVGFDRCGNYPESEDVLQASMAIAQESSDIGCRLY